MRRIVYLAIVAVAAVVVAGCGGKASGPAVSKGVQLFQERDYDGAQAYFESALAENPEDAEAAFHLGKIAFASERYDDAIDYLTKATELAPDSSSHFLALGAAYARKLNETDDFMQKGQLAPKIKTNAEKAVELDPSNIDARAMLAQYLLNAPPIVGGDPERGMAEVEEVKRLDPRSGHMLAAQIHTGKKEFDQARVELEAVLEITPDDPGVYYQLGRLNQESKDYDAAFAAFDRALELDPEHTGALYQYGRTGVFAEKNLDRCIERLRKFLTIDAGPDGPQWAHAHWRLGMLFELQKKPDLARAEYEKALELDPENEEAKKALEALESSP